MDSSKLNAHPAATSGNGKICGVTKEKGWWIIRFLSEAKTSPIPLWFHIEVDNPQNYLLRFIWINADQTLGNPNELKLLKPVLNPDNKGWVRCQNTQVIDTPDGRRELVFEYEKSCTKIAVAFCYPYTYKDLEKALGEINKPARCNIIGITGQDRILERFCFALPNKKNRLGVYVVTRQHAGETPGSLVMDGIIRFLASDTAEARLCHENIDWWFVPFVDLDGVENGDYGKNAFPCDFNRAWGTLPMRPEIHSIQRDLQRFAKKLYTKKLVIDLHAPTHSENGVYVFLPRAKRPVAQREATLSFVHFLSQRFPAIKKSNLSKETTFLDYWNPDAMINSWVWDRLDQTLGIPIEISYQSIANRQLDIDGYREIGKKITFTIYSWFNKKEKGNQTGFQK